MKIEYNYKILFSPKETGQEVQNEILLKQTDQQDNFSGFSLPYKLPQITKKLAIVLFCEQNIILLPNFFILQPKSKHEPNCRFLSNITEWPMYSNLVS